MEKIKVALTIVGSDSGGGAGIQADLKTFTALGVYGMSVITSITAQNTVGVQDIFDLPESIIKSQLDSVLSDISVDSAKTGMLSSEKIILTVSDKIKQYKIEKLVVDPVMKAKSGDALLKPEASSALISEIIPLAYLVTPNIPEAEALSGIKIKDEKTKKISAEKIKKLGPKSVLIKGGHFNDVKAIDLLLTDDGWFEFKEDWLNTNNTHGTGCTLSSAITAFLAKGFSLIDSIANAKSWLTNALKYSFNPGHGKGPLNHIWNIKTGDNKSV